MTFDKNHYSIWISDEKGEFHIYYRTFTDYNQAVEEYDKVKGFWNNPNAKFMLVENVPIILRSE